MRRWKIGIVGGGPGGLLTAYRLERLAAIPPAITIFEASGRLGGKVCTETFSQRPARYEAGAAEFYDYSATDEDPLKELVAELGLLTMPVGGTATAVGSRLLGSLEDIGDHLGDSGLAELLRFDRRAKSEISPREFYDAAHATWHPGRDPDQPPRRFSSTLLSLGSPARRFLEQSIHSDLATEPDATSHHYGLDNYVMNDPAFMRLYAIAGGNEQLIERLVPKLSATIRRRHVATTVSPADDDRIAVQTTGPDGATTEGFDAVVLALPVEPLSRISFTDTQLAAAVSRHLNHHDHPGHYLRISILFERPFWRRWLPDSYCMLDAFGGCCLYDEAAREPDPAEGVLGWLLGGEAARTKAASPDAELIAEAITSLPRDQQLAAELLLEARVHRWIGSVSGQPGGFTPLSLDARHCPDLAGCPRLLVVGDYLFDSTLNGVLDSADYVAGWLATMMANEESTP